MFAVNFTSLLFLSFDCHFLCHCQSVLRFLHKHLFRRCCLSLYVVYAKLFIVALIFVLCVFIPPPLLLLALPVGNGDSGK